MTEVLAVADVKADPNVRAFPLGNYDRKPQRTIDYRWRVREENDREIVLELSCWHTSDRKAYVASVNNAEISDGCIGTMPMSAARVLAESCPRYAKAKFEAFAQRALAQLREQVAAGELGAYVRGEHAPAR